MNLKRAIFLILVGLLLVAVIVINADPKQSLSMPTLAGTIAVVRIEGAISGGSGSWGVGGADTIIEQLERVRTQFGVEALVLRINSPGGAVAASQELYAEVERIRSEGIPVVVSMGDTAASGGYMVAMASDHIIANPGTITGSIGVIMELINYEELMDKLGIDFETFVSGTYKDMGSASRPIRDEERELIQSIVDDIHMQFVEVVATGRNMPIEDVQPLAQGQIFSGNQALENGLVDELGTFNDAIEKAAELADLSTWTVQDFSEFGFWEIFGVGIESMIMGTLLENLPFYGERVSREVPR